MNNDIYKQLKHNTSMLYMYCNKLWPDEFKYIYRSEQKTFTNWMNSKTGLKIERNIPKHQAVAQWLEVVEQLFADKVKV